MIADEKESPALVRTRASVLTSAGPKSLVARGRELLRSKEEAAERLRKGLELRDAAPDDPRIRGPINPYAIQPTIPDLRAQLQTAAVYINQVVAGSNPGTVAKSLGMTNDELEIAHVAYFFVPETFAEAMGVCFGSTGQMDENHASSAVPLIPRPAGMDDGVLNQTTVELSVRISRELERIQQQVRERAVTLSEAFRCFEMGHKLDPMNPELLYWLADSYYWGCGVQEQKETAVALYRRAADHGHSNSQYCLGVLCSDGEGVAQDEVEAAVWFRKAAEQGNTDAMVSLGLAYKNGSGVPEDYAQGAMWLRRAGEKDSLGDPI